MTTAPTPNSPPPVTQASAPDDDWDAADLGTAFGMECSLAAQERQRPLPPADGDETIAAAL
jgi:hypothetical protein